jgi:hypothetical protein
MTGAILVAVTLLGQVEVVDDTPPDAHFTITCPTKDAKVLVDGSEVGKVNEKIGVVAGDKPKRLTIAKDGCWDVHYELTISKGKNLKLRMPALRRGVSMLDSKMDFTKDFTVRKVGIRAPSKTFKLTTTKDKIVSEGDPYIGTGFGADTRKFKEMQYLVARIDYRIKPRSSIIQVRAFGWMKVPVVADGEAHTIIVVVGQTTAWGIFDYEKVQPDTMTDLVGPVYISHKKGSKGSITLFNCYSKKIDEKTFNELAKAYGQVK